MHDVSVLMAVVDYIPVALFAAAAVLLLSDLYNKMSKGSFALFAAGTADVFFAGFLKATWKLLYAANVCDFQSLNSMFFPLQSIGFLLSGIGIVAMLYGNKKHKRGAYAVIPPVYSGTFLFVGLMIAGLGCLDAGLCIVCARMKRKGIMVLFIVSFVCCLCMGYLSSRDFTQSSMNWIAECVNILGQCLLLIGVVKLHRAGLKEFSIKE